MEYRVILEKAPQDVCLQFARAVMGFERDHFIKLPWFINGETGVDIVMAGKFETRHEPTMDILSRLEGAFASQGLPNLKRENRMESGRAVAIYRL